jgi:YgiT-type zinc finger domain-containing protein
VGDCALCTGFTHEVILSDYQVPKTPTKTSVVLHKVKAMQCDACEEIYFDHLQTMELNQKLTEAYAKGG